MNIQHLLLTMCLVLISFSSKAQADEVIERVIEIKAVAGLKFDLPRIKVKPGERIKLVLKNNDEMDHNLVISKPGARQKVVEAALKLGQDGPRLNYVPLNDQVLWSVRMVTPGQSAYIIFKAPSREDVYPYVCTFPGHGLVMYGAMYVTTKELPPLEKENHVPAVSPAVGRNEHHHTDASLHPFKTTPPYLYRIFMPNAGPAAIAVSLPNKLSYCWDAGSCRLRYAWQGNFIDPTDYFNKKAEPYAKIVGEVFYRDKTTYPLRISHGKDPVVDFKGYKLIDRYPEFHYTLDGTDVYELIKPKADGSGLIRSFKVPQATGPVYFIFDKSDGADYTTATGNTSGAEIIFSANEAREFVITMTNNQTLK